MLFFALRMLGFGKKILELCIKHWKIILPIVVVVVEFFVVSNVYYNKGVANEKAKWEERIRIETEKNQKLTAQIAKGTEEYGKLAAEKDKVRVQKEIVHENRINTIIKEKPIYKDCAADSDILSELNAIRSLGK